MTGYTPFDIGSAMRFPIELRDIRQKSGGRTCRVTRQVADWKEYSVTAIRIEPIKDRRTPENETNSVSHLSRMDYSLTVTDRSMFTEPVTLEKHWVLNTGEYGRAL
jgi:hypothetical protein